MCVCKASVGISYKCIGSAVVSIKSSVVTAVGDFINVWFMHTMSTQVDRHECAHGGSVENTRWHTFA